MAESELLRERKSRSKRTWLASFRFRLYVLFISNMEVSIHIETECPVPNQTTDLKINLENVECIGDLKKKLQPLLRVAACDMSVYYKNQYGFISQKLENTKMLSNLYVQEGDTFIVKFVSVCNLPFISTFLDRMRAFAGKVCETFSEEQNIEEWDDETASAIDHCYRTVLESLQTCSYDMFVPWNCRPTNANRHYFVQEGGLKLLKKIYDFALRKRYPTGTDESKNDLHVVNYFNEKQNELEIFCLLCLWNFSEIKEDRQLVLREIGLEPFLHSLLKTGPDDYLGHSLIHVNEASVGCLAQYVELPEIQQILAENYDVLSKLIWLTCNASVDYQKQVAANTLFCCSNHPKAAAKIIVNHIHRLVLEKAQGLELARDNRSALPFTPPVAYFLCLFLANLQTLPEENLLSEEEVLIIDDMLEAFLNIITTSEIGEFQKNHNYVWITLVPFLQLALAGPSKVSKTGDEKYQTCAQVSVESLSNNDGQKNSRSNPSGDAELCQISESQAELEEQSENVSRNENQCNKGISNHQETTPYTFSPAEKMGLFCLCHLVNAPENRDLFKKEKLEDYLVCISWFAKRCPDVVKLTPKLDGFQHLEPPRLEIIAKAYLAKCFGEKVM